jgi:hypothetical protein
VPSLKPLKSVAHNLAHRFASTLNYWKGDYAIHHLANAAKRENVTKLVIDVLKQEVAPPQVQVGVVSELLPVLRDSLLGLLAKESLAPELLESATLAYNFSASRGNIPYNLPTYDCVCTLVTREGRRFEAHLTERNN